MRVTFISTSLRVYEVYFSDILQNIKNMFVRVDIGKHISNSITNTG